MLQSQTSDDLSEWLQKAVKSIKKKDPWPITVILSQIGDEETSIVEEFEFEENQGSFEQYADAVIQVGERDARSIGGGSYIVQVRGVQGRFAISFEGAPHERDDDDEGGTPSSALAGTIEDPNVKMAWGIQIEHNQVLVKELVNLVRDFKRESRRERADSQETIRQFQKTQFQNLQLYGELAEKKKLHTIEVMKMEKAEERKEKVIGLLEPVMMSAASRIMGPSAVPPQLNPLLTQIFKVFGTVSPEQFQTMMATGNLSLSQEQAAGMMTLLHTLSEMHEEMQKKAGTGQSAASGTENGDANAA